MSTRIRNKERSRTDVEKNTPALIAFASAKPERGSYKNWCMNCGYHRTEKPKPTRCPKCGCEFWVSHQAWNHIVTWRKEGLLPKAKKKVVGPSELYRLRKEAESKKVVGT